MPRPLIWEQPTTTFESFDEWMEKIPEIMPLGPNQIAAILNVDLRRAQQWLSDARKDPVHRYVLGHSFPPEMARGNLPGETARGSVIDARMLRDWAAKVGLLEGHDPKSKRQNNA